MTEKIQDYRTHQLKKERKKKKTVHSYEPTIYDIL